MTEHYRALHERRLSLPESIAEAADQIKRIDDELRKPISGGEIWQKARKADELRTILESNLKEIAAKC
ncbi:MAG: hypothetical protein WC455_21530 [Dehalococcoidia bacterium]|jgi:hypothetical protein